MDSVIKTRLSVEERPLSRLMRKVWSSASLLTVELELYQLETLFLKNEAQRAMLQLQKMQLQAKQDTIESQVAAAQQQLQELQQELQIAKERKQQKIECDIYAKRIVDRGFRSRKIQSDYIANLRQDIQKLEKEQSNLLNDWKLKYSSFASLVSTLEAFKNKTF